VTCLLAQGQFEGDSGRIFSITRNNRIGQKRKKCPVWKWIIAFETKIYSKTNYKSLFFFPPMRRDGTQYFFSNAFFFQERFSNGYYFFRPKTFFHIPFITKSKSKYDPGPNRNRNIEQILSRIPLLWPFGIGLPGMINGIMTKQNQTWFVRRKGKTQEEGPALKARKSKVQ